MDNTDKQSLPLFGLLVLVLVFTVVMTLIITGNTSTSGVSHVARTVQPPFTESEHEKPNDSSWEATE